MSHAVLVTNLLITNCISLHDTPAKYYRYIGKLMYESSFIRKVISIINNLLNSWRIFNRCISSQNVLVHKRDGKYNSFPYFPTSLIGGAILETSGIFSLHMIFLI